MESARKTGWREMKEQRDDGVRRGCARERRRVGKERGKGGARKKMRLKEGRGKKRVRIENEGERERERETRRVE